jgi:hypothetical protein
VKHALALSLLPLAALPSLTACSSTPSPPRPDLAAADCSTLAQERQRLEQTRHDALERQQHAWQAVIPFAVAARYGSARSVAREADEGLAAVNAASARQGCRPQG